MTVGDLIGQAEGPTTFAARLCLRRGSTQAIDPLPKPGDKLWNEPVLNGELVTVLHCERMEYGDP